MAGKEQEKKTYIVGRIKADKLEDWLNELVANGYVKDHIYMEPRSGSPPKFTVIMRLEEDDE